MYVAPLQPESRTGLSFTTYAPWLNSKALFNADIRQNFTSEEVDFEKQE